MTVRGEILELLRSNATQYISGEEISKRLAVSRTAVWKHMQAIKQAGYEIEAHPRQGYRLKQVPDLLLPAEIEQELTTTLLGRGGIHYFSEIDSTNTKAKQLANDGCPSGAIVLAEAQNSGRGRLSRGWFSPAGRGIWLSAVLRPPFQPQDAPKCTLLAAVAAARAIRQVTGVQCGIKWPNDILYQGRKLVGILTEMSAEMDAINYVVIGLGVNVNIASAEFPEELTGIATSLQEAAGQPVERKLLLRTLLAELENLYMEVCSNGFAGMLAEWRNLSVTLGQEVEVSGGSSFRGRAVDIDEDGALLVDTGGRLEKVLAGDVTLRPR